MQNGKSISVVLLLILALSGCGGGGSTQVIEGPPATPSGVSVAITNITTTKELTITWNSVPNAASYNVYWSNTLGASKSSTKISGITTTSSTVSYAHAGLTTGATYYYVVTAVNSYGESLESVEVFALLDIPHPPGAVAAVAGDGQATLSWSSNGAISYNVYMATQSGVTKTNYASLPSGMAHTGVTSPFTHTGLVNGTTYYFVVTGVNSFGESVESSEMSVTPAAGSSLTVSGTVKYEDKEYGAAGFTGNTSYKAVRYAVVEAVVASSSLAIVAVTTDAAGAYTLTIPSAYSASTVYIRALSSAVSPASATTPLVAVKYLAGALHAAAGTDFIPSGTATVNLSIPVSNPAAGAFNILDVFTSAGQFVYSLSGGYPPALTAYWQVGSSYGTYYCASYDAYSCPNNGGGIYVLNSNGDTDEYDDDVMWHEYGHFVAAKYSKDDSPGGVHYISTNDLDLRLSWSEGWGDFFPAAVKAWLGASMPSLLSTALSAPVYVDTSGSSASSFNFGNPVGPEYFYASNEAAVAKVLIGMRNTHGMQAVWDSFTAISPATAIPVNLEVFWDAWNSPPGKPDITATLSERAIKYFADSYEAAAGDNIPNPSRLATLGQAESHTLFGSGDVDYVAFDAVAGQPFTIKTTALRNGADTYIRIITPDQTTEVTNNDNTNGANYANTVPSNIYPAICDQWGECHENIFDILGSTTGFTATAPGTYYVEVKSSPNRPLSAGRYGDYVLTITSP